MIVPIAMAMLMGQGTRGMPEEARPAIRVGAVAPSFDLVDIHGKRLRLEEFQRKSVLLNFCAFWCDTWKDEMPELRELAERQDDLNFQIISISVDGTRLPEFAHRVDLELRFPVALDVGGSVSERYHIEHVPTVVLLDADGRIRYTCVAWPGNQVILNQLRELASPRRNQTPTPRTHVSSRAPSRRARRHRKSF